MGLPKILVAQNDFSGGEINVAAKRQDNDPIVKTGARQMSNWRVEATGSLVPRPGRTAVFVAPGPRVEYVRMTPTHEFLIVFSAGTISIYTLAGALVTSNVSANYLWDNTTVTQINWCQAGYQLTFCFPGMKPELAMYAPVTNTWTFQTFAFRVQNGQTMEPFYRFAAGTIRFGYTPTQDTAHPIGGSGTNYNPVIGQIGLAVSTSAPFFTNAMIGRTISVLGQQCVVASVSNPSNATVNLAYVLPSPVSCLVDNTAPFEVGQIVEFKIQLVKIEVAAVQQGVGAAAPGGTIVGTLTSSVLWPGAGSIAGEQLISALGFANVTFGPNTSGNAVTVQWLEEFMSPLQGWPQSCFYDKGRLGFCDFPQAPEAILWSAVGLLDFFWIDAAAATTDQTAGALPDSAILELVAGKPRVKHVVGWGDEFVFTDRGIYQIPLSAASPLKPGNVEFRQISNDGVAPIRPIPTQDTIVYINAGKLRASVIRATGSYTRPYISEDQSNYHSHLFTSPRQLVVSTGDSPTHPERYAYVVNDDGSVPIGKFAKDRTAVGWVPWSGQGTVTWATISGSVVYYTTLYGTSWVVEVETDAAFLDAQLPINAIPSSLTPPGGKGPIWFAPSTTVNLMDGLVDLGQRSVDANGFVLPLNPGEDLSPVTLAAGFLFQPTLEPFTPDAQAGTFEGQRQKRRKVARAEVAVQNSTGFQFGLRAIPAYNFGDDATQAPPQRERNYSVRTIGRTHDARPPKVIKDRPGPIRICEYNIEVTV